MIVKLKTGEVYNTDKVVFGKDVFSLYDYNDNRQIISISLLEEVVTEEVAEYKM